MKKIMQSILAILVLCLAACQNQQKITEQGTHSTEHQQTKLSVVTSFYPVYYMTKEISGEHAQVSMLIQGNIEPHDYEPSAKNIADIDKADLFIYSSEYMETWAKKIEESLGSDKKVMFVASGKDVEFIESEHHEHEHGESNSQHDEEHEHSVDPHIWLDPTLAKTQVNTITQALIQVDPEHKADYENNQKQLLEKLDALVKEYDTLKSVQQKRFVTQHEAFGYIAERYNLEQITVTGLQNQEPSAQAIAQVIDEIKEHQLSAIYVEAAQSSVIAQAVASQTGVRIEQLYTMETAVDGKDYLEMLKENIQALKTTLK
ncbi:MULTISPECIES: metal ABC transporter solute-binding protein, Zn/Mn family [unclassified Granulicatella]|uniref:metal ABC transporter solute-binding protein, Zn/Mn family n=1 Tax=unclassified Granulicatella TaxID=2630493 RepID=UPI00107306B9|nr:MULTISPECIES: zinc ABC transporter substrate-binding protein [unclassified Granulicatella]MBF0779942.1 zinc ABC transporter substrate-binding protein [Granulicatella sp. 19428wC4_WM01]TFU95959.1 zinc ABC transporter substrate-binding protein [Granulicatella sp. WM01]